MKIIWIDGTFGIGKSAVAAAIVKKIPQAHLLEFDALQEKYKPTSDSDRFGRRYPEAKKYLVDALVDEITEIIQEGGCNCLVIPVALINDYCNQKLIDGFANIESHHFILTAKTEILHQRINNQENRDIDLAVTYMPEATQYLSNHYYDASLQRRQSCLMQFISHRFRGNVLNRLWLFRIKIQIVKIRHQESLK